MTDRKTRLAFAAGGVCLAIGLLLIVSGIYFGVSESRESARLQEAGQAAEATALVKLQTAGRRYVRISYRFRTWSGDEIAGRADIPNEDWDVLQRNQPLRVTYDRENPSVHRVAGQKLVGWAFVVWIILGAIPAALGGILMKIGTSRLR